MDSRQIIARFEAEHTENDPDGNIGHTVATTDGSVTKYDNDTTVTRVDGGETTTDRPREGRRTILYLPERPSGARVH